VKEKDPLSEENQQQVFAALLRFYPAATLSVRRAKT
jgi:hypothetical protein